VTRIDHRVARQKTWADLLCRLPLVAILAWPAWTSQAAETLGVDEPTANDDDLDGPNAAVDSEESYESADDDGADGESAAAEPRILPEEGPRLAPARTSQEPAPAPTARIARGTGLIRKAYEQSQASHAETDYTSVIQQCQDAIQAGLSTELKTYAHRLISWAHNRRGEVLAAEGRNDEALADFQRAVRWDKARWRAVHNRGVSYALAGEFEKAVADFQRTTQLNPDFADAYFNLGEMQYELGDFSAAVREYDRALRLDPNDIAAWNGRGHAYYRLGKHREALRDFTEAIRIEPDHTAALTNRGDVFFELGYFAEALRDYRHAIEVDGELGRAHQSLAWLLATCPNAKYRDPAKALAAARRAIALDGDEDHHYLDTLAAAQAGVGNFDEARKSIRRAIQLAPKDELPRYQARLALYEQQKTGSTPRKAVPQQTARRQQSVKKRRPSPTLRSTRRL
jgi:tetratricopeptide (TPR) repeat protein